MFRDVPGCSGMFRNVPECSGMFHVPAFTDGLFDVPKHRQEEMFVCPKHRHNLGRNWRPLRTCRYSGARKKLKNNHVINLEMSKNIHAIFGITIPIGLGKHSTTQ